jgi:hypothetical protein
MRAPLSIGFRSGLGFQPDDFLPFPSALAGPPDLRLGPVLAAVRD